MKSIDTRTFPLPGGATLEMVWIKEGTFGMGSPPSEPGRHKDEGPQHPVTITRGFWLGRKVVTQEQWERVMGTRPWSGQRNVRENPNHPAVWISWDEVQAFIAKVNQVEGAEAYRLPTEAEWEYACRAGTTTRWSSGDDESPLKDYAWYDINAQYAHAAGSQLPNPWGLYDMHGNVWEWVQDWYGAYSRDSQVDPTGPSTGLERLGRGGSFCYPARSARSANRSRIGADYRCADLGARLLRQEA